MARNSARETSPCFRVLALSCLLQTFNQPVANALQCYVCDDIVSRDCLQNSTSTALAAFLKQCATGYDRCVTEDIANMSELDLKPTEPAVLRRCDKGPAVDAYTCNMGPNPQGKTSNVCTCSADMCNGKVEFKARRAWEWKYIEFDRVNKAELARLRAELSSGSKLSSGLFCILKILFCLLLSVFLRVM